MIENGIRGERCEPIYYYVKANNKYVNPNFDKNKQEESYIISIDANSLYASAMCYELQCGEIKFDCNICKNTDEHILNLNPYGEYLFVFLLIYITQNNFTIEILNFQFYVNNLYLQMIRLQN